MKSFAALFKNKKGGHRDPDDLGERVTKDDFEICRLLGKGSFAKVLLVKKKDTGKVYAMKVVIKESVMEHQRVQDVFTERGVLLRLNHPFLCKLHYCFQSDHKLFFVMDYYNGGDLDSYLNRQQSKKLPRSTAQLYGAEILLALQHLHANGIVYRDLKPENVLLGSDGHPCLTDFGLAKDFGAFDLSSDDRTASFVGSPFYVAPDVLRQRQYNNSVDYWSFGVLLFRMMVGRPPFLGRSMQDVFQNILYQELRFSQSNPIDEQAMSMIGQLLEKDPAKRATGEVVKRHPFWSGLDWDLVYEKHYTPAGWQPPDDQDVAADAASSAPVAAEPGQARAGSAESPMGIAATPAGQGPLGHAAQELFAGFTFTASGAGLSVSASAQEEGSSPAQHSRRGEEDDMVGCSPQR
eukprot:TRINITY_DN1248_c0_g1_i2.p1 TRINITY_DN1248_c0_g1~~TRINITY_DN1248_c0_g1_i2.p1  ORF type:complete len:407 (+),score=130.80 TRINITY_DN1248_c0_g1_i2:235-1455(+)